MFPLSNERGTQKRKIEVHQFSLMLSMIQQEIFLCEDAINRLITVSLLKLLKDFHVGVGENCDFRVRIRFIFLYE